MYKNLQHENQWLVDFFVTLIWRMAPAKMSPNVTLQHYFISLNPSAAQTPSEIQTQLFMCVVMALIICSQQRKTLCSYPEGLMANFGPKNIYFALGDSGLAK
jgi:hypothetical protein